jgi:hypothetical protein
MTRHAKQGMSKHARQGWPTWKIVTVAVISAFVGTAFLLSLPHIPAAPATSQPSPDTTPGNVPDPAKPIANAGLGNIVILLGLMGWALALLMVGWLTYRMYMRIPAWKRRQWFGRR